MKKYMYPDGMETVVRPVDGEQFMVRMKDGSQVEHIWDGLYERWIEKKYSHPARVMLGGGAYIDGRVHDRGFEIKLKESVAPAKIVCECGSEKVNSPIHSSWCAKYEKD